MAKSYAPGLPPEQRAAMNNGTFAIRVTGVLASGPCNRFTFDVWLGQVWSIWSGGSVTFKR